MVFIVLCVCVYVVKRATHAQSTRAKSSCLFLQVGTCHAHGDGGRPGCRCGGGGGHAGSSSFSRRTRSSRRPGRVWHHAFALVLVQLHVQAPLGDTRDDAVVGLPQAVLHELHLLVLHAGPLGRWRPVAPCCCCARTGPRTCARRRCVRARPGSGWSRRCTIRSGVAAYGRGEVRVVVEGQPVVAYVVGRVACLLHGAYGDGLYEVLLLLALHVVRGRRLMEVETSALLPVVRRR